MFACHIGIFFADVPGDSGLRTRIKSPVHVILIPGSDISAFGVKCRIIFSINNVVLVEKTFGKSLLTYNCLIF